MPPTSKPSLHAKIAKAQETFGDLERGRTVDTGSYSYSYISDDQLFRRMREVLSPMGVAVYVSNGPSREVDGLITTPIEIVFADAESGETFTIRGEGAGSDKGDKAVGKAITSGVRVTLVKQWLQAGGDDGEQRSERHRGTGARPSVGPGPATEPQIKLLRNLGKQLAGGNPAIGQMMQDSFGHHDPSRLSKREATDLIDAVKAAIAAQTQNGNGNGDDGATPDEVLTAAEAAAQGQGSLTADDDIPF